jgi:hypothetical protein
MVWRAFLVPQETVQVGPGTVERPAYIPRPGVGERHSTLQCGHLGAFIVYRDASAELIADLEARADVIAAPPNLQNTVNTAQRRNAIENRLEAWGIPAQWVTLGITYATILRGVACLFMLANEMRRRGRGLLPSGVTMSTTMAQLTPAQREVLQAACDRLGWNTEGIPGSTTVRQFLRIVALTHARTILIGQLALGR